MLRKAEVSVPRIDDGVPLQCKKVDHDYKEELSELSEASDHEPCIKYYQTATNAKGKNYTKSRRCIKCRNFSVAYCGCCGKTFCYSIGTKNHGRTCLVDHIKEMKRSRGRKRLRSNAV